MYRTDDALSFELLLLDRMTSDYVTSTLREIGLSPAEAALIRKRCRLRIPEQLGSSVATYASLLGPEATQKGSGCMLELLPESVAHSFRLVLWPHLFWVVHSDPAGRSLAVGFQNQVDLEFEDLDPSLVRVGLWTRFELERLADSHEIYDGWDEEVVVRFAFGKHHYEGKFVFGLLQRWKRILTP